MKSRTKDPEIDQDKRALSDYMHAQFRSAADGGIYTGISVFRGTELRVLLTRNPTEAEQQNLPDPFRGRKVHYTVIGLPRAYEN